MKEYQPNSEHRSGRPKIINNGTLDISALGGFIISRIFRTGRINYSLDETSLENIYKEMKSELNLNSAEIELNLKVKINAKENGGDSITFWMPMIVKANVEAEEARVPIFRLKSVELNEAELPAASLLLMQDVSSDNNVIKRELDWNFIQRGKSAIRMRHIIDKKYDQFESVKNPNGLMLATKIQCATELYEIYANKKMLRREEVMAEWVYQCKLKFPGIFSGNDSAGQDIAVSAEIESKPQDDPSTHVRASDGDLSILLNFMTQQAGKSDFNNLLEEDFGFVYIECKKRGLSDEVVKKLEASPVSRKQFDKMMQWHFGLRKDSAAILENIYEEKLIRYKTLKNDKKDPSRDIKMDFLLSLIEIYKNRNFYSREELLAEWARQCRLKHVEVFPVFEDKADHVGLEGDGMKRDISVLLNYMRYYEKDGRYVDTEVIRLLKSDFGNAFIDQMRGENVSSRSLSVVTGYVVNLFADMSHKKVTAKSDSSLGTSPDLSKKSGKNPGGMG